MVPPVVMSVTWRMRAGVYEGVAERSLLALLGEDEVQGVLGGDVLRAGVAEGARVDAGEQVLAAAEHDGAARAVQLVAETRAQRWPDGAGAAEEAYVEATGRRLRPLQRRVDPVGDEMESGAAFHRDGVARMVSEHEDVGVVGRVLAPPALPVVVGPRAALHAEHVAAHDPSADVLEAARGEVSAHPRRPAGLADHALKSLRPDEPPVQRFAADAERFLAALLRPCAVAVERDREAVHAELRHDVPPRAEPSLQPASLHARGL